MNLKLLLKSTDGLVQSFSTESSKGLTTLFDDTNGKVLLENDKLPEAIRLLAIFSICGLLLCDICDEAIEYHIELEKDGLFYTGNFEAPVRLNASEYSISLKIGDVKRDIFSNSAKHTQKLAIDAFLTKHMFQIEDDFMGYFKN